MFMISSYLTSPSCLRMIFMEEEHCRMPHVYINHEYGSHDPGAKELHIPFWVTFSITLYNIRTATTPQHSICFQFPPTFWWVSLRVRLHSVFLCCNTLYGFCTRWSLLQYCELVSLGWESIYDSYFTLNIFFGNRLLTYCLDICIKVYISILNKKPILSKCDLTRALLLHSIQKIKMYICTANI